MPQLRRCSQQLENASLSERRLAQPSSALPVAHDYLAMHPHLAQTAMSACRAYHLVVCRKGTRHEGESSCSSAPRAVLAGIRGYILVMVHFMPTTVRPQRWENAFNGSPPVISLFSEYSHTPVGKEAAGSSTKMCDTEADANDCTNLTLPRTSASFATVVTAVLKVHSRFLRWLQQDPQPAKLGFPPC